MSTCHMGSHSVTCKLQPDRGDSHAFTPACCRYSFIDSGRMKGWVDLGGWLYQDGLPTDGRPSGPTQSNYVDRDQRATTKPQTNKLRDHLCICACDCLMGSVTQGRLLRHEVCNVRKVRAVASSCVTQSFNVAHDVAGNWFDPYRLAIHCLLCQAMGRWVMS